MALALEARAMKDDIMAGDTPKAKARSGRLKRLDTFGRLKKHSVLADVKGLLSPDELQDYFVFMMVRNPWDRMVSYYHWLQDQKFKHPAVDLSQQLKFADFVAHPQIADSMQEAQYGHYVMDAAGSERCDLFVRLEHLATDIAPLEAHLGFRLDDIPHVNKSARTADYRTYYSDPTREMVGKMSMRDIERFGYSFD